MVKRTQLGKRRPVAKKTPVKPVVQEPKAGWMVPGWYCLVTLALGWWIGGGKVPDNIRPTPGPDPIVDPQPGPQPGPVVVTEGSHILMVERMSERGKYPHLAQLQREVDYWHKTIPATYKAQAHWYDIGDAAVAAYKAKVEAGGLPAMVVVDKGGHIVLQVSTAEPMTVEQIDAKLKGGKP